MAYAYKPGEVRNFKMKAAEGLDREGLVLKVNNDTPSDPRVCKITTSGDVVFGIGFNDTNDQEGNNDTGGQCSVIQDGEPMVAVEAATYKVGDAIYIATTDGFGVNTTTFDSTKIGVCQEYKVVTSAMVTAKTNQVRVRLTFIT